MRLRACAGVAACFALALPALAHAHAGRPPAPHDLWTDWQPPVGLLALLALLAVLHVIGTKRVWRRAGSGRGVRHAQAVAFALAIVSLLVALASPLDLAAAALFSAHMVQHLILVLVAGPLLAYARPEIAVLWALPPGERRAIARWWVRQRVLRGAWRALASPAVAWTMHAVALWAWHTPRLYDAAARIEGVHLLEHATFLVTAVLFARPLLTAGRVARRAMSPGAAVLYLFGAAMQSGILGALLTLSGTVWFGAHLASTGPWGLTPLEDQQIAGVLMWGPAGGAYLLAILWTMRAWLNSPAAPARAPLGAGRPASGAPSHGPA